jgi:hypothetical protein
LRRMQERVNEIIRQGGSVSGATRLAQAGRQK